MDRIVQYVVDGGACDNPDGDECCESESEEEPYNFSQDDRTAPAPVPAPRGLTGMIDAVFDKGDAPLLDAARLPAGSVLLNVYDVSDSETLQSVNKVFTANGNVMVGGVFHGGIEVYGKEWCYGGTPDDRSGVCYVRPRLHPQHTYKATVNMGITRLSETEVERLMARMQSEWRGNKYNLLHHNCCTFCNVMLEELGLRRIPGWVDRAARAASNLDHAVKTVQTITAEGVQNQAAEALGYAVQTVQTITAEGVQNQAAEALGYAVQTVQTLTGEGVQNQAVEALDNLKANLFSWGQQDAAGEPRIPKFVRSKAPSDEVLSYVISAPELGKSPDAIAQAKAHMGGKGRNDVDHGTPSPFSYKPAPLLIDLLSGEDVAESTTAAIPVSAVPLAPGTDLLDDFGGGPHITMTVEQPVQQCRSDLLGGMSGDSPADDVLLFIGDPAPTKLPEAACRNDRANSGVLDLLA